MSKYFSYLRCHKCARKMEGIIDYTARKVCYECGGEALNVPDREEFYRILREKFEMAEVAKTADKC